MISLETLLAVSLIWTVAAVTPGPNFFITVHTAVGETRRLSLCTVMGIVAGTCIWAVSGFLGISLLFTTMPYVYYFLKIVGGLYLVYIGAKLLLGNEKKNRGGAGRGAVQAGPFKCFKLGFLTNILNPKTAAFMTSLFAATIPQGASYGFGGLCVLCILLISTVWYSSVALLFSYDGARTMYITHRSIIERIAGAIFIIFGIKLAAAD